MPDLEDGSPFTSFFETEQNYWTERARDNLLLVHYNDLTVDLATEIRRVARFSRSMFLPPYGMIW